MLFRRLAASGILMGAALSGCASAHTPVVGALYTDVDAGLGAYHRYCTYVRGR